MNTDWDPIFFVWHFRLYFLWFWLDSRRLLAICKCWSLDRGSPCHRWLQKFIELLSSLCCFANFWIFLLDFWFFSLLGVGVYWDNVFILFLWLFIRRLSFWFLFCLRFLLLFDYLFLFWCLCFLFLFWGFSLFRWYLFLCLHFLGRFDFFFFISCLFWFWTYFFLFKLFFRFFMTLWCLYFCRHE